MKIVSSGAVALFRRWQCILRREGLIPFIKQGFSFLVWCFFSYQTFYPYKVTVDNKVNEVEFTPKIQNFSLKIISTNEQADELITNGFDFDYFIISADERLNQGAIAFCVFVERELVYMSWIAMTKQAKDSLTHIPYPVDFSSNEAYSGGTVTNPKYQQMGIFSVYVYFKVLQFLWQSGIPTCRFVVSRSNRIAQNTLAKRGSAKPYGEGRYLKLLWWKFWKEKPINMAKGC